MEKKKAQNYHTIRGAFHCSVLITFATDVRCRIAGNFYVVKLLRFRGLAMVRKNFTLKNLPHEHNELRYLDTRENFALKKFLAIR